MDGEKKKLLLVLAVFALVFALATAALMGPLMRVAKTPDDLCAALEGMGALGHVAFTLMVTLQVVLAVIPGEPLEVAAGYLFGPLWGTVLCQVGIALGTYLIYLLVHRWGRRALLVFFSEEKLRSVRFLRRKKGLYMVLLVVFFVPGTPKDLLTYAAACTRVNPHVLVLFAAFARLPSIVTSTLGGAALEAQRWGAAVWVFAATAVVSLLGLWGYRLWQQKRSDDPAGDA